MQQEAADTRRAVEIRLDRIEDIVRKQRRDSAALLVMARSLTANFTEALAAVEERVAALEARNSPR